MGQWAEGGKKLEKGEALGHKVQLARLDLRGRDMSFSILEGLLLINRDLKLFDRSNSI